MKKNILTAGMFCCLLAGVSQAEVVVVAHAKSDIAAVDANVLKDLFLGKTSKVAGLEVRAVNLPDSSALKMEFDEKVVGKDAGKMKAYWSNRIFTGQGKPLDQVDNEAAMLEWLGNNKDGIGYMSAGAVNNKVKVLLTIP
jgi:ABC-type phosphate transport system substrate-binding protein